MLPDPINCLVDGALHVCIYTHRLLTTVLDLAKLDTEAKSPVQRKLSAVFGITVGHHPP